jgi:hypothetical protein
MQVRISSSLGNVEVTEYGLQVAVAVETLRR